ncbi:MAG TPA: ATP synthase F0 subunit B [Terriglobales bacterium]|nr:ATP synthase F0 subunit B [Terriglobales bacterium]
METLRQLGELLLTSIPAIISLLIVWGAYQSLVYRRLQQVLAERHARTEGAVQNAQQQIATAERRTAEYEQKMREARSQIYKTQEAQHRQIMESRSSALAEARKHADEMLNRARAATVQELEAAKASLQKQADSLADEIIDSILRPAAATEGGR